MRGMLALVGMSLGGWIGWELGSLVSLFTGFIVAVFGTAIGLYGARRFAAEHLP